MGGTIFTTLQDKDPNLLQNHIGHPSVGSLIVLSIDFDFKLNNKSVECCDIP